MATRQEKQIADDLIRFVNIMNDLLDVMSIHLKGKNERTGEKLNINVNDSISQIKAMAKNVLEYERIVNTFVINYGKANVEKMLTAFGFDFYVIWDDVVKMKREAMYIISNVGKARDKIGLASFARHIDSTIPKLILVRRTWCVGRM